MVDQIPQSKQEEQYPLLKVEGGGGDGGYSHNSSTIVAPAWGVSCQPKHSWYSRLPELFSACWMTLILLGISFLIFYSLGMSAYRRQPIIVIKCNNTRPASDVYYHKIVQRGAYVPFMQYSDYISAMATQYPSLRFMITFLIDDSVTPTFQVSKQNRFINKCIPYNNAAYKMRLEESNRRELKEFQLKHPNVNVSFIPLSRFMAMTPLKNKWKTIPQAYLPFYARVFSVWQTGGIGADLTILNNQFNNRECVNRKISTIFMQHNDGIKLENYASSLNAIEREEEREENEFFNAFYTLFHQILNDTKSFLNKSLSFNPQPNENEKSLTLNAPLIRIHRDKRELSQLNVTDNISLFNGDFENLTDKDVYIHPNTSQSGDISSINVMKSELFNITGNDQPTEEAKTLNGEVTHLSTTNTSNVPQMVLFYDFSIISDGLGPSYILPELAIRSDAIEPPKTSAVSHPLKRFKETSHVLSMSIDGVFLAASSSQHPLLGHLLASGCKGMHPKFAIQDALMTKCSGSFQDDAYCNNIYIL